MTGLKELVELGDGFDADSVFRHVLDVADLEGDERKVLRQGLEDLFRPFGCDVVLGEVQMDDRVVVLDDADECFNAFVLQVVLAEVDVDDVSVDGQDARYLLRSQRTQGEALQDELAIDALLLAVVLEPLFWPLATLFELQDEPFQLFGRALVRIDMLSQSHVRVASI